MDVLHGLGGQLKNNTIEILLEMLKLKEFGENLMGYQFISCPVPGSQAKHELKKGQSIIHLNLQHRTTLSADL